MSALRVDMRPMLSVYAGGFNLLERADRRRPLP
jgi:hypothetical protein